MARATPRPRDSQPTAVDVARLANVSQATVSRAFSGGPVSRDARERIDAAAKALGYAPNAIARGLVTSRSGLVGVLVADITNPFYPELLEAVGHRLSQHAQHMLLQNATTTSEEAATRLFLEQRVDGMIFATALRDSESVYDLILRRFPLVLINRVVEGECDSVQGDNVSGAAEVVDHLVALGHRRIATIEGNQSASTSQQRALGFLQAMARHGLRPRDELRMVAGYSYEAAFEVTLKLLGLPHPPSAIFCHNDLMGFAALNAARSVGVAVPAELSIVGFDDIRQASWESFGLTTVRQPLAEMADRAVALLQERIADPSLPGRREVFESRLVPRTTTARRVRAPRPSHVPPRTRSRGADPVGAETV